MVKIMAKSSKKNFPKPVSSLFYTKKYYLNWGDYPIFIKSKGQKIFSIHQTILNMAQIKPGMKVLDLGCGKGELLVYVARLGAEVWGVDYSKAAIQLAKKSVLFLPNKLRKKVKISHQDLKKLNLPANYYDRILIVALIEHVRPWEVDLLLKKIKPSLKKNGKVIIHTAPNRYVPDYGIPLYRFWHLLARGKPAAEAARHPYDLIMHINEQTQSSLKKSLESHGYLSRVWLEKGGFYEMLESFGAKKSVLKRIVVKILALWPLKHLFFNHIYSIAWKE
jgi:2-polyprenyl-3-methyl-5-hydroxy-6-metoxy-1,4-benzoquinol methylase